MDTIVLDSQALAQFTAVSHAAKICDSTGAIVGYFQPVAEKSLYESIAIPFTDEEIARAARKRGGRELREILKDLEKNS